jgi:hypothetical protein
VNPPGSSRSVGARVQLLAQRTLLGLALVAIGIPLGMACAGGSSRSAQNEPEPEPVVLRVAWPEDLTARVEVRVRRVRDSGAGSTEKSVEARYTLRSEPHPFGLRIAAEALEILRADGKPYHGFVDPASDPALLYLASSFVVDEQGAVVEVEGIEALRKEVSEGLAGHVTSAQREAVARLAANESRIVQHWMHGVAQWVGMELEPGATYEAELEDGFTTSPGLLKVSEPIACSEDDPEPRCVRLRVTSELGGAVGAESQQAQFRAVTGMLGVEGLPADVIQAFESSDTTEVVVEPESLVPHRIFTRREKRFVVSAEGETMTITSLDEEERRYVYPR